MIVTRADKGNITVILNKNAYTQLSQTILDDPSYYQVLPRDPTISIQNRANKLVSKLKSLNLIDDNSAKKLRICNQTSPKFYGLPKIHKETLSVRPIISSINSPNSNTTYTII